MKLSSRFQTWASGVLGFVCVLLLAHLALQVGRVRAGGSKAPESSRAAPRTANPSTRAQDDLARFDPVVRLELLKEIQSRPLPKLARNPFEFEVTETQAPAPAPTETPSTPPPPPGPPPVPLQALGYGQTPGGTRQAYVSDGEQVHVVREGDQFARRFRVLKITPRQVEVQDETSQQSISLPIAQ